MTLPALASRLGGPLASPGLEPLVSGLAILAAGFLLTWAAEVVEKGTTQALAVAVLALIILLPEYSVDVYLAWVGADPARAEYASYAMANMTGANRLLLGLAWPMFLLLTWVKQDISVPSSKAARPPDHWSFCVRSLTMKDAPSAAPVSS